MVAEMAANIDRELDVTGDVCPMPFVKAKLTLESMPPGQLLRIVVDYRPAFDSMPLSLALEGHEVVWAGPVGGVDRSETGAAEIGSGAGIGADAGPGAEIGSGAETGADAGPGAEIGSDPRSEPGSEIGPATEPRIEAAPPIEPDSDTGPWEIFVRCRREEAARV